MSLVPSRGTTGGTARARRVRWYYASGFRPVGRADRRAPAANELRCGGAGLGGSVEHGPFSAVVEDAAFLEGKPWELQVSIYNMSLNQVETCGALVG